MKSLYLLSLLLHIISTVHTAASLSTPSTTDTLCIFDHFYYLRPSPPPTCSLSPPRASEAPPELLSFEEWKKARQVLSESVQKQAKDAQNISKTSAETVEDVGSARTSASPDRVLPSGGEDASPNHFAQDTNEHFRVPLTDRFNFASQDCTARIHSASKGAKSTSAVLSNKKDRYMLSPCAVKEKFVVVELCDDVRIDTVQLANLEFFSGVFKDVRISLAETSPSDWIDAGVYRAKNIRGVQSFHPPAGRQKFYRYIRIDFLSHYGNEYYCPVSLLRVYGLTHMEDYKWAGWQTGHEANVDVAASHIEAAIASVDAVSTPSEDAVSTPVSIESDAGGSPSTTPSNEQDKTAAAAEAEAEVSSVSENAQTGEVSQAKPQEVPVNQAPPRLVERNHSASLDDTSMDGSPTYQEVTSTTDAETLASPTTALTPPASVTSPPSSSAIVVISSNSTAAASTASSEGTTKRVLSASAVLPVQSSVTALVTGGGESIYRTIMKRLQMLEVNITLGVSYMEEQMHSVRDVVRRLEEDVGRLDAVGQRQQRVMERALLQVDKQREDTESEVRKLMVDIQTLTREVALEKRLGFIQLCLLICAFIFMGYTRGTREQTVIPQAGARTSEPWRSGDWARWRTRRASGDLIRPAPVKSASRKQWTSARKPSMSDPFDMQFPQPGPSNVNPFITQPRPLKDSAASGLRRSRSRQRVLSSPSLPMALIRRSSPRRLAPHLHEVKTTPEPSKRRHQINLAESDPDADGDEVHDGTPRPQRTFTSQQLRHRRHNSQPHSPTMQAFPSFKFKGKEREDYQADLDDRDREVSPASTAAGGEDEESEDSAMWEDTSIEDGDEFPSRPFDDEEPSAMGEYLEPQISLSSVPLPVKCEANPSQETLRVVQSVAGH